MEEVLITLPLKKAASKNEVREAALNSFPSYTIESILKDLDDELWRVTLIKNVSRIDHRIAKEEEKEEEKAIKDTITEDTKEDTKDDTSEDMPPLKERAQEKKVKKPRKEDDDPMAKAKELVSILEDVVPKLRELVGLKKFDTVDLPSSWEGPSPSQTKRPPSPTIEPPPRPTKEPFPRPTREPSFRPIREPAFEPTDRQSPKRQEEPPFSQPRPYGPDLPKPRKRRRVIPPTPPLATFTKRKSSIITVERPVINDDRSIVTESQARREIAQYFPNFKLIRLAKSGDNKRWLATMKRR